MGGWSPALGARRTRTPKATPRAPSLNGILRRLEANLNRYDADLPDLFCDEHVVSSRTEPGVPGQTTVIDSVFRVKRTAGPGGTTFLAESREIRSVNGKPAASQHIEGPSLLSGFFEGGLAVVSLDQSACMNYALERIDRSDPARPYVIRFTTALTPRNSANCLLQEKSKGRAFIDPASMELTRLEITTPHHVIIPGSYDTWPVVGKRVLTVAYAPVRLGGETFWLPSTITMQNTSGFGFHRVVWSFRATYRRYHRTQVTSRILPGGRVPGR